MNYSLLRRLFATFILVAAGIIAITVVRKFSRAPGGGETPPPATITPISPPVTDWLRPLDAAAAPLAVRFDYPVGSEEGALAYNAQPFLENGHLGDDWNGIGGWNSDLGDPVYASATGMVVYAGDAGGGWGNLVILAHRLAEGRTIQSFYAHLDQVYVAVDTQVSRGTRIGTIGNAEGRYLSHLHYEIRDSPIVAPGKGYAGSGLDRTDPTAFIEKNRGRPTPANHPSPSTISRASNGISLDIGKGDPGQ